MNKHFLSTFRKVKLKFIHLFFVPLRTNEQDASSNNIKRITAQILSRIHSQKVGNAAEVYHENKIKK